MDRRSRAGVDQTGADHNDVVHQPYRPDDPNNVPLAKARERFLEQLALHTGILPELLHAPVRAWKLLSAEAQKWLTGYGWAVIVHLVDCDPNVPEGEDPKTVAFCRALVRFGRRYHLTHDGSMAVWAMDTAIDTIIGHLRPRISMRTRHGRRKARWVHSFEMHEAYPARTEDGWIHLATREPEKELCTVVIEVPPKQPRESFKAFEQRLNRIAREERKQYVQALRARKWKTDPPYRNFTWIDRFAQWQTGHGAAEIAPSIKLPAFSRSIKETGDYIGITPRLSKHNPNRRPGH